MNLVVWYIKYFKTYLYSKHFTVITDHRALLSILKDNRFNKSYRSRSTRWIDRLLLFQFDTEHFARGKNVIGGLYFTTPKLFFIARGKYLISNLSPGANMGLVDFISRHPISVSSPGTKMRLVDYISRHPNQKAKNCLHMVKNSLWPN